MTRDAGFEREGAEVAHSLEEALDLLAPDEQCWVIGGGQVYQALIGACASAEVTKNHCVRPADTFFPNLDDDPTWRLANVIGTNEEDDPLQTPEGIAFEFCTYERARAWLANCRGVDAAKSSEPSWSLSVGFQEPSLSW